MGTIWVREFRGGLDVRRAPETSAGGTLMRARDCHINRGGEIEQRSDFVSQYELPDQATKGLARTPAGLYVFGHQSTEPSGIPSDITYMQLEHPSALALASVPYWTLYESKLFVIGEFADGSRHLFYDGTRISDANAPPNTAGAESPNVLLTHREKVFVGAGSNLFFSAVSDATDFGAGAGSGDGVINMATHAEGAQELTGLARYDDFVAVFSRETIQIWFFDPDPALSRENQELVRTGTRAPRSVTQFGDGDVFYLDRTGIRSLRARDSSNSAATTDIGSAIDALIRDDLDSLTDAQIAGAKGIIEPRDGRFWLILDGTIYVFSYFTASKVSAWSEYRPGFTVDDVLLHDDVVYVRSEDIVYTYGDASGTPVYSSDTQPDVWLPYLDADEPFRSKKLDGIDAALRGKWEVRMGMDVSETDVSDKIGVLEATTFGGHRISAEADATHFSLRFKCLEPPSATTPGLLSSAVIHFDRNQQEDSA